MRTKVCFNSFLEMIFHSSYLLLDSLSSTNYENECFDFSIVWVALSYCANLKVPLSLLLTTFQIWSNLILYQNYHLQPFDSHHAVNKIGEWKKVYVFLLYLQNDFGNVYSKYTLYNISRIFERSHPSMIHLIAWCFISKVIMSSVHKI